MCDVGDNVWIWARVLGKKNNTSTLNIFPSMKESTQKESAYSSSKNPRTMWQKMIKRWRKCECCYSTIFFCGWRLQRCLHFRSSSRVMPTSFWSELTHSPYLVRWKKMQKWKKRKEKERNMRSLRENRELDCTQQNKLTESFKRFVYRGGGMFEICLWFM